ncbi:MAG: LysR family transcriptional regulator [Hydrocarboniphaga sp.]|uniref:DoxX family protein n=1 Tax=Hydrocarboniphaga sp. TaxID=2033016 RepID=UPI00261BAFCF|nr:DoxX family protein [Hydrocarboniphaga sp.]MDB5971010.1 LysR family transcriptional regulator [Hydrocarboniphaga sp.]
MNTTTPIQNPSYPATVGRVMLSLLFLAAGFGKLAAPAATKGYIASVGLPAPDLAYLIAVVVEVGFGLALLVGFRTRIVAAVLAAFSLVTAVVFHNHFADQNQMIHFLKNLAIAGGLIQLAAASQSAVGIDRFLARRQAA